MSLFSVSEASPPAVEPATEEDVLGATERAGLFTYLLCNGGAYSAQQASVRLGIAPDGASKMLHRLARVIPIRRDDGGLWRIVKPPSDELVQVVDEVEAARAHLRKVRNQVAAAEFKLKDLQELQRIRAKHRQLQRKLAKLAQELEA